MFLLEQVWRKNRTERHSELGIFELKEQATLTAQVIARVQLAMDWLRPGINFTIPINLHQSAKTDEVIDLRVLDLEKDHKPIIYETRKDPDVKRANWRKDFEFIQKQMRSDIREQIPFDLRDNDLELIKISYEGEFLGNTDDFSIYRNKAGKCLIVLYLPCEHLGLNINDLLTPVEITEEQYNKLKLNYEISLRKK